MHRLRPVLSGTKWSFIWSGWTQLANGLVTISCNWQLQSSCNQFQPSPVAGLFSVQQLDFTTLHLLAPNILLWTLQTTDGLSVFLSCTGNIISSSLITMLKSMAMLGCHHISFSYSISLLDHFHIKFPRTLIPLSSNLEAFWVDTHLALLSSIISFKIGVLCHSPLRYISLQNTGLSWSL